MLLSIWNKLKLHFFWLSVFAVLVLYAIGYHLTTTYGESFWSKSASTLAATILTGGIFASLLKSYQFIDVFKDELRRLFREPQFIDSMKDIVKDGVTGEETLCNAFARVAALSSPALEQRANQSFSSMLSIATDYSLRSYKRYVRIVSYNPKTKIVVLHDEVTCEVVVGNNDTNYRFSEAGFAVSATPFVRKHTLTEHGGAVQDLTATTITTPTSLFIEVPVKKGKIYKLIRVVEKSYPLFQDPNVHQQFKRFVDGLEFEVENFVPTLIEANVVWVNFDNPPTGSTHVNGASHGICNFSNVQLTFPYQGFILTMSPKI